MAESRVPDVVAAAVAALEAIGARAYTHVPKGTDPPYELVMGGDELPWALGFACDDLVGSPPALGSDGGDSGGRTVDVIVSCVSTFRGSAEVDDMASDVLSVLSTVDTWAGITGFQAVDFVRNTATPPVDVAGDGVMWFQRAVVMRVTVAVTDATYALHTALLRLAKGIVQAWEKWLLLSSGSIELPRPDPTTRQMPTRQTVETATQSSGGGK